MPSYASLLFNLHFLLFSLIFYFTAYSVPFLFPYITSHTSLSHMPLDIYLQSPFHSIRFNFHPTQFSIPYPVQVRIPFPVSFQCPLQAVSISSSSAFHFKSIFHSLSLNTPNAIPDYPALCFIPVAYVVRRASHSIQPTLLGQ